MLRKKLTLAAALLACFSSFVAQAQDTFIGNTENRTFTNLNGKWNYILDHYKK